MSALDWNGKLSVVSGSPLATPYPRDRCFWIVTDEGEAVEVAFHADAYYWTGRETYARQDGESGDWEPDSIMGWTDNGADAVEAALLLAEALA